MADATEDDRKKAFEFEKAYGNAGTAFTYAFTRLDSDILPVVSKELGKLNDHIKKVEKEEGGIEAFFTEAAAAAGLLIPPLRAHHAHLFNNHPQSRYAKDASEWVFGKYKPHGGSFFGSNRGSSGRASSTSPATNETQAPYSSMDYLVSQGYTLGQAAGILGNAKVESAGNPTPAQNAYNAGHYGKFQWDATRRATILAGLNIDVATASEQDQDKAFVWEAHQRGDDAKIQTANNEYGAAAITNSYFERSGSESINARMRAAHDLATQYSSSLASGSGSNSSVSNATSVKIDDVTINTQATDALA